MNSDPRIATRDPFRWRSALLLMGAILLVCVGLGEYHIAGGAVLGLFLYATNIFLILEMGRALLRGGPTSKAKLLAALGSAGRLLFLASGLSLIAVFLGREVVLGACGGFLITQVNLHVPRHTHRREGR